MEVATLMLLEERVRAPDRVYPTLEVVVEYVSTGTHFLLPSCCFHDFWLSTDQELAGMGLAIIANVCKLMRDAASAAQNLEPSLWIRQGMGAEPRPAPWPGMPTDSPYLPLRPEELPFDVAMFFDEDKELKRRVDRLALMHRIEEVWVPWLRSQLRVA